MSQKIINVSPASSIPPIVAERISLIQVNPLLEYLGILRRSKAIIAAVAFLGMIIGLLTGLLGQPIYQARTSLELQGLNENLLGLKKSDPAAGVEYSTEAYIQTQMAIIKSDSLLERVALKLHLDDAAEFAPVSKPRWDWRKALGITRRTVPIRERMLESIRGRIAVQTSGLTRILQISFDSPDPREAAEFLNALATEYIEQSVEARLQGTEGTSKWLGQQLDELRVKLERSDDQLQAYARTSGLVFTRDRDNLEDQKLQQMQAELSAAQADRVAKQAQYELAMNTPAEALPQVLSDSSLRNYQNTLVDLRRQYAEANSALTPENPKSKRIQAQITALEASLEQEKTDVVKRIKNEFETAKRRQDLLAAHYYSQWQLVSDQSSKAVHYDVLKHEVDSNRQLYDAMLQQVKEANVAAALRTSTIRVVDPARPPFKPYKPDLAANACFGLFPALFFACGLAVVKARTDVTLKMPGDAESSLAAPELGLIPLVKSSNLGLVTWRRNLSTVAESFRYTVASVRLCKSAKPPKIVVFTSANPSEGKSTTISNVGIAWAQTSRNVLLIDADMRKPVLHHIFELPNRVGLGDILRGTEPIQESMLPSVICQTSIPNLSVLCSGENDREIVNRLYSSRLEDLLNLCRLKYDVVLIDTPPMLQMPDARILGRLSDGVILIIRSGRTDRGSAVLAARRLAEDGTPLLGSILNSFDFDIADRYYQRSEYYA